MTALYLRLARWALPAGVDVMPAHGHASRFGVLESFWWFDGKSMYATPDGVWELG